MERAAAKMARQDPAALSDWTPGQAQPKRRPGLKPEIAQPHEVANLLSAEEFFSHVAAADRQGKPLPERTGSEFEPPFYYSSGAIDEKVRAFRAIFRWFSVITCSF